MPDQFNICTVGYVDPNDPDSCDSSNLPNCLVNQYDGDNGRVKCAICDYGYQENANGQCVKCTSSQKYNNQIYKCETPFVFDLYKVTELIPAENKLSSPPIDCRTDTTAIDNLSSEVFTIPMMNLGQYIVDSDMGY